jgi:AAA domain
MCRLKQDLATSVGLRLPNPIYRRPVFPDDTHLLQETIQDNNARRVIVDPLMAFLSARACSLNDQMIRQALVPLAEVAEGARAAVLVVRHLNKGSGQQALYRGLGSIGIIATVRSGLLVGRSPYDADHRVLACTKSNLAQAPASQGFDIRAGEHGQPVPHWTGAVDLPADDLVVFGAREHGALLRRAKSFLEDVLRNGPCREIDQKRVRQASPNERCGGPRPSWASARSSGVSRTAAAVGTGSLQLSRNPDGFWRNSWHGTRKSVVRSQRQETRSCLCFFDYGLLTTAALSQLRQFLRRERLHF